MQLKPGAIKIISCALPILVGGKFQLKSLTSYISLYIPNHYLPIPHNGRRRRSGVYPRHDLRPCAEQILPRPTGQL